MELLPLELAILDEHVMELDDPVVIFLVLWIFGYAPLISQLMWVMLFISKLIMY